MTLFWIFLFAFFPVIVRISLRNYREQRNIQKGVQKALEEERKRQNKQN